MTSYSQLTDQELTGLLRDGDRVAYTEVYHRYKRLLYLFAYKRLGNREEVMDMVQEIFLSLWQNHETLQVTYTLSTYLHSAARNKIIDLIAHRLVTERYAEAFNRYQASGESSTDHLVRHKLLSEIIEKEIAALPPKMRQVFELSRKTNASRKEIADELGLSEQTVKSHLQHALKILKVSLKNNFTLL